MKKIIISVLKENKIISIAIKFRLSFILDTIFSIPVYTFILKKAPIILPLQQRHKKIK